MEKSADAFRTISEVAADLALPQHVLRFWETRFPQIRPLKRAGGRRYYRPNDVGLLRSIRRLLYDEGYTIKGVQRLLKEGGARGLPTPDAADAVVADEADANGGLGVPPFDVDPLEENGYGEPANFGDTGEEALAASGPSGRHRTAARAELREALACIEECERILGAVMSRR